MFNKLLILLVALLFVAESKSGPTFDNVKTNTLEVVDDVTVQGNITVGQGTGLEFDLIQSLYRARSTGIAEPTTLAANAGDNTKFDLGQVVGQIVDTNTGSYYPLDIPPNIAVTPIVPTSGISYIFIDETGTLQQQTSPLTAPQKRLNLFIGRVVTNASSVVSQVVIEPVITENAAMNLYDLTSSIGIVNINGGNRITPNGANLSLDKSAGKIFDTGANYTTDRQDPNRVSIPDCTVCGFFLNIRSGINATTVTTINPSKYDNAGVLTTIPNPTSRATNQKIFVFPSGNLVVQYGQQVYSSLANAVAGIANENFVPNPAFDGGVLIATLSVIKGATDLSDTSQARFTTASIFGGSGASAAGSTSLQQSYLNSIDGNITLDSTRTSFELRDALSPIGSPLFEIVSNDQLTNYFSVDIDGISTPSISVASTTRASHPCPNMTTAERDALATKALGDCIYNTTVNSNQTYDGATWVSVGGSGGGATNLTKAPSGDTVNNTPTWVTVTNQTLTITTTGIVDIKVEGRTNGDLFGAVKYGVLFSNSGGTVGCQMRILRDSSVVVSASQIVNAQGIALSSLNAFDDPPAGSHTYEMQVRGDPTRNNGVAQCTVLAAGLSLRY